MRAWDRLAGMRLDESPIEISHPGAGATALPNLAWSHSGPQPGDAGAVLAAILKQIDGPRRIRDVRLAAALVLEPRLLVPLLSEEQAAEWRRLVGAQAAPLQSNVVAFSQRINASWGAAVRSHRGSGRLIENLQSGTWGAGGGLDAIDTTSWPNGRAGFVLQVLKSIDLGTVVTSLPADVQAWIANAATA